MNARIITPWEQGEGDDKEFLSFPVAVTVDRPCRFFLLDAFRHERVSETVALEPGTHHFTVKLTRPVRYVRWVLADTD